MFGMARYGVSLSMPHSRRGGVPSKFTHSIKRGLFIFPITSGGNTLVSCEKYKPFTCIDVDYRSMILPKFREKEG